jgi:hypothetical protein
MRVLVGTAPQRAAHKPNNTIAVGTLIQVKNAQSNDALVLTVTDGLTFCF